MASTSTTTRRYDDGGRTSSSWGSRIRSAAFWLLLLCAIAVVLGRFLVREQLDVQILAFAQRQLESSLPGSVVEIDTARRVRGHGIELRGVRVSDPRLPKSSRQLIAIENVMLTGPTELSQFLLGEGFEASRITASGVRVRAVRAQTGTWNVHKLLSWKSDGGKIPEVIIQDARVELIDASQHARPIGLHSISAQLKPTADGWGMTAQLVADRFGRITLTGEINRQTGVWSTHGALSELDISSELRRLLPANWAESLASLEHVQARGELQFRCQGDLEHTPRFVIEGQIRNGRLDDARLPYPLNDISAHLSITNDKIQLSKCTATMAGAAVQFNGQLDQWLEAAKLTIHATASGFTLDPRIRAVLSERARTTWDRFRPSGLVDLGLTIEWEEGIEPRWDAAMTCRDVSIIYQLFPYPLHHLQGVIRFGPTYFQTDNLVASAAGTPLRIDARLQIAPGNWAGDVAFSTAGVESSIDGTVPIDRQLIGALSPSAQEFVAKLQPTGRILLKHAKFGKERFDSTLQQSIQIDIVDGSLVFTDFPYPLTRVAGTLSSQNSRWEMKNFQASHGTTQMRAEGHWDREDGQKGTVNLAMKIWASEVDLDPDLRAALMAKSPSTGKFWDAMRPTGVIDELVATLTYRTTSGMEQLSILAKEDIPRSTSAGRTVSINPTWFPYSLDRVTGSFRFVHGQLQLQKISGWHDQTQVRLEGVCDFTYGGNWRLQLSRLSADRVAVDAALTEALPGALGRVLEAIRLHGLFAFDGVLSLGGGPRRAPTVAWNMRFDVAGGSFESGMKFEQLHGGLHLIGRQGPTEFHCRGEWDVDSVHVKGVQISRISGPIFFDAKKVLMGAWAEAGRTDQPPRSIEGRVLGGNLSIDGQIKLDPTRPYELQVSITDSKMSDLFRQWTGRAATGTKGDLAGTLRLTGEGSAAHTRRGRGAVRLRNASLYELPVVVALLSVVSLKTPDRSAFSQADIDFRIEGDQLQLDRIDLVGNAITLKGRGWANFDQEIRLNFYSLVGRDEYQVPFLRNVLAAASKQILEIQVAGTLSQPRVQQTAFPELDDTLKLLFPEMVGGTRAADQFDSRGPVAR